MEILNQEKVKALREVGEYTYQDAYDAALRLLDLAEPADAIFCANDIMALGVMDAAKNGLGLKVPEEVSITRGTGFPVLGFKEVPLVENPPNAFKSSSESYSKP